MVPRCGSLRPSIYVDVRYIDDVIAIEGPGFLTWSRGQNSHGNSIAGPLPRSFMGGQWVLAKQILARYRELGIAGQLKPSL